MSILWWFKTSLKLITMMICEGGFVLKVHFGMMIYNHCVFFEPFYDAPIYEK